MQPTNRSTNQVIQSTPYINQTIKSITQSTNQSINQSTNQSNKQTNNQSSKAAGNQPIMQSIKTSTNQSRDWGRHMIVWLRNDGFSIVQSHVWIALCYTYMHTYTAHVVLASQGWHRKVAITIFWIAMYAAINQPIYWIRHIVLASKGWHRENAITVRDCLVLYNHTCIQGTWYGFGRMGA